MELFIYNLIKIGDDINMAEYNEEELRQVKGGMDPRFVIEDVPYPSQQVDELTEEQLMNIFGGIPHEYAEELAKENSEAFRAAAIDRILDEEINSGDTEKTSGGLRR